MWGATIVKRGRFWRVDYFNPRSPCGERRIEFYPRSVYHVFQSTLPVWGATGPKQVTELKVTDFNPRSPCGERRSCSEKEVLHELISIHAPRVGSDRHHLHRYAVRCISIHAPRVGSDTKGNARKSDRLSISIHAPRVGSDARGCLCQRRHDDFNPRSPCGERPDCIRLIYRLVGFQSTLPVWGATTAFDTEHPEDWHFNPRSPCGERLPPFCF